MAESAGSPNEILAALEGLGLLAPGEAPAMAPLDGGISSDIWRVDLAVGPVAVKRALPQLRVPREWKVPVARNHYEAEWMRVAGGLVPGRVPGLVAEDRAAGLLVMDWLDPADHPVWKEVLRRGVADDAFAARVGQDLAAVHAGTAGDPAMAARFPSDAIFRAIRIDAYLGAAAARHPDLAPVLDRLAETTASTRLVLVHGDVSPKNILVGPAGPVFLDAECAWFGDPVFDLAFCLNHLLLKCLWNPAATAGYLRCFDRLAAAYLGGVDWEPAEILEGRAARLLPGLALARVDGKSPVEYLTAEADRDRVRRVARALLVAPPRCLDEVRAAWAAETGRAGP